MVLTQVALLDELLQHHASPLGKGFTLSSKSHLSCVQVLLDLVGSGSATLRKIAIAAAFHDLGIWTDGTFDYLHPSEGLAQAYLDQQGHDVPAMTTTGDIRRPRRPSRTRQEAKPTAHLISGLPCSGKTTYAVGLRANANRALFSLDRWLISSFGRYAITSVGHEEHTRRVLACREQIWNAASELLSQSVDVILDDGFFLRDDRVRYVKLSNASGARTTIHYVDTPVTVIRTRLEERNAKSPPFNFHVDPETLQEFVELFEVPSDQEGAELVVVPGVPGPSMASSGS